MNKYKTNLLFILLLASVSLANAQSYNYVEDTYRKVFKFKFPGKCLVDELSYPFKEEYSESRIYGLKQDKSMTVHLSIGFKVKPEEEYFKNSEEMTKGYIVPIVSAKPYKTTKQSSLNWYYRKYYTLISGIPVDTLEEYTFLDPRESTSISFTFKRIPQKEVDYLLSQVTYTKPKWEKSDYFFLIILILGPAIFLYLKFRSPKAL